MYRLTVLLAEDDKNLRKLVSGYLKKEGYRVLEASDGEAAMDLWYGDKADLAILDVMMPGYDGWTVLRNMREESDIPVIMLTARGEEGDKLFGFEIGADDYVTKPFSPKELMARVKALMKRRGAASTDGVIDLQRLRIDNRARKVFVEGEQVELTPNEFGLLLYFADNSGIALSREQILDHVWGYDYFGDLRTVDTHVKRLRQKLGALGGMIRTVRGVGYRFEVGA